MMHQSGSAASAGIYEMPMVGWVRSSSLVSACTKNERVLLAE